MDCDYQDLATLHISALRRCAARLSGNTLHPVTADYREENICDAVIFGPYVKP